jgi:glycosyltransferase involved in cell wall biosynthesis
MSPVSAVRHRGLLLPSCLMEECTAMPSKGRPLRVLAKPAFANRQKNPYNALFYQAFQRRGVLVADFSISRLLQWRSDIVHIHWPDIRIARKSLLASGNNCLRYVAYLLCARLWGAKIIWTVHNTVPHDNPHPRLARSYLSLIARLTAGTIHLSRHGRDQAIQFYPVLQGKPSALARHGHYRGCYPDDRDRAQSRQLLGIEPEDQSILFLGMVKAYKNVDQLVSAFVSLAYEKKQLVIAGGGAIPGSEMWKQVPHVRFDNHFIPDDQLQTYYRSADLCVLPFRAVTNSGSALCSLSFDCPVLLPNIPVFRSLRQSVGPEWVFLYDGDLQVEHIRNALRERPPQAAICDLSQLDWERCTADVPRLFAAVTSRHYR